MDCVFCKLYNENELIISGNLALTICVLSNDRRQIACCILSIHENMCMHFVPRIAPYPCIYVCTPKLNVITISAYIFVPTRKELADEYNERNRTWGFMLWPFYE